MPWFLAHYSRFATRIFCHDNGSTDRTREIVAACPIAETVEFDSGGTMRDDVHQEIKNNVWKGRDAEWVICVDADEFLHSPQCPMEEALCEYRRTGNAVPRPIGYQMGATGFPQFQPGAQLTDHVTTGVVDHGYSKPCLFDASRIAEMNYSPGAHDCRPALRDGGSVAPVDAVPPLCLLHFKYAYELEWLLRRHETLAARLSEINRQRGWGSQYWDRTFTSRRYQQVRGEAVPIPCLSGAAIAASRRSDRADTVGITVWTLEYGQQSYFPLTDEINRHYCRRHGYPFHVFRPDGLPDDRHANWAKVLGLQYALATQREGLVLYLDRDAYFHDHDRRIEDLLALMPEDADYLFGTDRRDRQFAWHDELLSTGVFLVRCTESARRLAREWWEVPATRPDTLWTWPVDQNAMNHLRTSNSRNISVVSYHHLAGTDGEFIRHAAGVDKHAFLSSAHAQFRQDVGLAAS